MQRLSFAMSFAMLLGTALVGCAGDPKAATNDNFARVIEAYYEKPTTQDTVCLENDAFLSNSLPTWGQKYFAVEDSRVLADGYQPLNENTFTPSLNYNMVLIQDASTLREIQAFTSLGLLKRTSIMIPGTKQKRDTSQGMFGYGWKTVNTSVPGFEFTVATEKGKDPTPYCYVHYGFDHVENFTVPGSMMGYQVTEVTYAKKILQVSDWANDKRVQTLFPEIEKTLSDDTRKHAKITLELTNNGWEYAQ